MKFTIDGFEASNRMQRTDPHFLFSEAGPAGIHGGGVGIRVPKTDRPQAHGSFTGRSFREGRLIVLDGTAHSSRLDKLEHGGRRLSGVLSDGGFGEFIVESSESFSGVAQLESAPKFKIRSSGVGYIADWQLQLWCADPILYGEPFESDWAQTVAVANQGNFPATPVVSIRAETDIPLGYRLRLFGPSGVELGNYLISAGLAAGEVHAVDMGSGWVRKGSALLMGAVANGRPFTIPKYFSGSIRVEPVTGTATCRAEFRHSFI